RGISHVRTDRGPYEFQSILPPTPGPSTPSASPAGPPTFLLTGTKVKIGKPGTGQVGFSCTAPGSDQCTVSGTLTAGGATGRSLARPSKSKTATVGSVSGMVGGGKSGTLTVRLTKRGLKLLRAKGKLRAGLSGTVTNNVRASAPLSASLLLKPKRTR